LVPILDVDGQIEAFDFEISEEIQAQTDGTTTDTLTVGFSVPSAPALSALSIPVLSLSPTYANSGGILEGESTYYYAISAVDAAGNEGDLSFTASINLPAGPNTYTVTLSGLSFPANSATFHMYRGLNPQVLYRIASNAPLAASFLDIGLPIMSIGPPDASFDHANFYYRYEYAGPYQVTASSATTIACADMGATAGAYVGFLARIISGTGQGQELSISSNDQTTLTISPQWSIIPDSTSEFVIVESTWIFAAVSNSSPVTFEIAYAVGEVIEISGRSANVNNQEASSALCPITRWALGDGNPDYGMAGVPNFVLSAIGAGNLALTQVGFGDTSNTHSVTSGTLQLFHWNELNTPSRYALAAGVDSVSTTILLNQMPPNLPYSGQAIQIGSDSGSEVVFFSAANAAGNAYLVTRGELGSTAVAHSAGDAFLLLDDSTIIVPFAPGFFENASSSNYIHTVALPDVRIIAAEFFVNNAFGKSQALQQSYAGVPPESSLLRTLSGGQFSLQVNGYLATQQNAAPPLLVQATHAIRDMRATLNQAASGYDIVVTVLQNGVLYGNTLTIPSGDSASAIVEGVNFAPLLEDALLTIDIALNGLTSTSTTGISPGRDLTVTIRF
jgi:hypothetical protein